MKRIKDTSIFLLILLFGCSITRVKYPKNIRPVVTEPNKYEGVGCRELADQRLSINTISKNLANKYEDKINEYLCAQKIDFHTRKRYRACYNIKEDGKSEIKKIERKIASYRGDLEAIDSKFPTCKNKNSKSKIEINNNINIDVDKKPKKINDQ